MKNSFIANEKMIIATGLLLITAGALCNEWFLAALFSTDGTIANPHRIVIWIVDLLSVSLGSIVIIFRKTLKSDTLLVIAGSLFVLAGLLFNEWSLAVLLNLKMTPLNKIVVRVFELYLISTGLLTVFFRKSFRLKNILLYVFSSAFSFALFLGFDYYSFYSEIMKIRSINSDNSAKNVLSAHLFAPDDKLGWKLIPNSNVRHMEKGKFDVTYEIDENGFRRLNNTTEDPDFSIYFFGDSFTFGHGVNNHEAFPALIKEKYLKENVNVYNTGVMGYGIVQMFQDFLNMKVRIRPGDLIIFVPTSEDIKRNLKDFQFPYFIKFTNIMKVEDYPVFDNGVIGYRKLEDNIYNKIMLVAMTAPYTGEYFKSVHSKFIPDTTHDSLEMIKIAKRETELKGGKFVLFFLPKTEECLNGSYAVDIAGFSYIDIMHFFPSVESELNTIRFNGKDSHWNVRGHEIAAKAIVETLTAEGIIDKGYIRQNRENTLTSAPKEMDKL